MIKGIGAAMVGWTEHRVCNGTGRSGIQGVGAASQVGLSTGVFYGTSRPGFQGIGAAMAGGTEHRFILWDR